MLPFPSKQVFWVVRSTSVFVASANNDAVVPFLMFRSSLIRSRLAVPAGGQTGTLVGLQNPDVLS